MVKQISVFLENKKGRLFKLTQALAKDNIDLIAVSIADTANFGILRCIVNDPEKALKVLKEAGYTANTTDVLAVEVPDKPGGLASVLEILTAEDLSVEYLYSFVRTKNEGALILFRVEEMERAIGILAKNNINILSEKDVYNI